MNLFWGNFWFLGPFFKCWNFLVSFTTLKKFQQRTSKMGTDIKYKWMFDIQIQKPNYKSQKVLGFFLPFWTVLDAITAPHLKSLSCFSHLNLSTKG